jgi:HSP20 family protein
MNRVFERFESGWPGWSLPAARWPTSVMVPDLDVHENDKSVTIEAELPGVDEKDVSVTQQRLSDHQGREESRGEKKDNYYVAERSFGSFERSLQLPQTLDDSKIEARFDKGVLKITAPKRLEALKTERKISIGKG